MQINQPKGVNTANKHEIVNTFESQTFTVFSGPDTQAFLTYI